MELHTHIMPLSTLNLNTLHAPNSQTCTLAKEVSAIIKNCKLLEGLCVNVWRYKILLWNLDMNLFLYHCSAVVNPNIYAEDDQLIDWFSNLLH